MHECLSEILWQGMAAIDEGLQPPDWITCFPEHRRPRLRRFNQFGERIQAFLECYTGLGPPERARVRQAMADQAELADLFNGERTAERRDELPGTMGLAAQALFTKAFEMLVPLGIRDENYERFFELLEHQVCPFCGCEPFESIKRTARADGRPGIEGKREPLDHYLAISLYPFAGANSRNLIPIGWHCNTSYKGAKDVLRTTTGVRRVCFDPYDAAPVRVSLMRTRLYALPGGLPEWHVDLVGDPDRIATWDDVFNIRRRYADSYLNSIYRGTFKSFGELSRTYPYIVSGGVVDGLIHLAALSQVEGLNNRAFLKTAVYELLISRCQAGGAEADRIIAEYSDARLHAA